MNFIPTEKQLQVIDDLENNVLMLASAGTGKTNTLARRVQNIIESNKAKPNEILCITFTNRACKEMNARIITTVGINGKDVKVKTIHSFCYEVIKSHAKNKTDLYSDFIIFDEDDCKEIIKNLPIKVGVSNATIHKFIGIIKNNRALFGFYSGNLNDDYNATLKRTLSEQYEIMLKACYEKNTKSEDTLNILIDVGVQLIGLYNDELRDMNALDFEDLLIKAYELLKDPQLKEVWSNRFKYINIDEVQDVNILEYNILKIFFGSHKILLCGDYFQTIYGWRGSEPMALLTDFIKYYTPREIVLHQNFRATKNLVDASYNTLVNMFGDSVLKRYNEGVVADSDEIGEKISLYSAYDIRAEAQWIFKCIKEIEIDDISKICILTRTNPYNQELCNHLLNLLSPNDKYDFLVVEQFKFFRREEIKDILAFIKLFTNKYDTVSLRRILKKYVKGVGEKTIEIIESDIYKQCGVRITDFLEEGSFIDNDPFHFLLEELDNVVIFDVESTGTDVLNDEIIQIAAVKLDCQGHVIETFERFLKPSISVSDSYPIHGFSDEFLSKNAEEPMEVLKDFMEFTNNSVIVGHNVNYDINIFTSQLLRNKMPRPNFTAVYDTLDIFRRYYPNLENHKLEHLSKFFEINHKPTHNALDDVEATRELLLFALNHKIKPSEDERKKLISLHADKFKSIYEFANSMTKMMFEKRPDEIIEKIIVDTKIKLIYDRKGESYRNENIDYFVKFVREADDDSISSKDSLLAMLALTALSNSELDSMLSKTQKIPIITVHQAKGIEFEYVFVAGLKQNTFPLYPAIVDRNQNKPESFNEEKRVFYVAITRAKKKLYLSYPTLYQGRTCQQSEFINRIPDTYVNKIPR